MIEKIVRNYIASNMSIDSYLDAPENKPSKYILIRKSGATGDRHIETAIFTILLCSSKSLSEAASMNETLKEKMYKMPESVASVSKVELNTDGNYTDPSTKLYRYQAIYEITYHR